MKNWLYILYIGLMGCFVTSCQLQDDEVQLAPSKVKISFTVVLDDFGSRASGENNEATSDLEVGSNYDNQINIAADNSLQVFVYDLQGKLLGQVINKDVYKIKNSENTYNFNGEVEISNIQQGSLDCRLMVYANYDKNEDETFEQNSKYIPMWGIKTTRLNLKKGEAANLVGPIYLLRAMAKVQVKLDATIKDKFDLQNVSIDKYNVEGNVKPISSMSLDTEELDSDAVFNPNNRTPGTNLDFNKITNDEFSIYLPEYQNVGDGASPAAISVVINDVSYKIKFGNYTSGQATGSAYNIVRNHYYQYTITSVNTVDNVLLTSLSYKCMPWQDINNGNLNFGNADGNVKN